MSNEGQIRELRRPSDLREATRHSRHPGPAAVESGGLNWPDGFAASEGDRGALLVLLSLASLTARRLLELAARLGTARACLAAVKRGECGSVADVAFASSISADAVGVRLGEIGARLVAVGDPEYPPQLLDLFDPPAGLFVAGERVDQLTSPVAIVGARNCSPSGGEIASLLARGLAGRGLVVVSGGARGIDAAAHRGAIEAGGITVAVLGCGLDVIYPRQNRRLFESVARQGSIVSEYPPGTPAEPFRFPARNRIVAALSRAVVVVEGAAGSGSMITADHALDLGRDVFAIPGAVTSALAHVPLALIREGATMIRGPDDLLGDLGFELGPDAATSPSHPGGSLSSGVLLGREAAVWDALTVPSAPDRLASVTALPLGEVISALVGLELRGLVRQLGGRYERRLAGSST